MPVLGYVSQPGVASMGDVERGDFGSTDGNRAGVNPAKTGDRFESITLVSPYPDATLTRLNPGTLIIRFTIISASR